MKDVRSYNVGASDYSKHKIQPWDIWEEYNLNPWDADIVKRVLRTKGTDSRRLDYEKIIHICEKRIQMLKAEQDKRPPELHSVKEYVTGDGRAKVTVPVLEASDLYIGYKIRKAYVNGVLCTLVGWTADDYNFCIFKIDSSHDYPDLGISYGEIGNAVIPLENEYPYIKARGRYFLIDVERAIALLSEYERQ